LIHHPYSINLAQLFASSNIPVIIDQKGVSGELVVPSMVERLKNLLKKSTYDWVIILGGTNDLGCEKSADQVFNEGLKLMYDMVLQHTNNKTKLVAMTLLERGFASPDHVHDAERQKLNKMISNYVENFPDQTRICLVDLDKLIPFHSLNDISHRNSIWGDMLHLTPDGYDQMADFIFQEIYKKLQTENKQ
jgi:lysophospholipase L1-like esterase